MLKAATAGEMVPIEKAKVAKLQPQKRNWSIKLHGFFQTQKC